VEPREYGELGLRLALSRLVQAIDEADSRHVLVAVAEVLFWLRLLEDHHSQSADDYYDVRDGSPEGQTLAGLMYARNLTTHSLAAIAELIAPLLWSPVVQGGGRRGPKIIGPLPLPEEFLWRSLADLPPPDRPEGMHRRDLKYKHFVQGRAVLAPLQEAAGFLLALP
jgi:hypothetical protein